MIKQTLFLAIGLLVAYDLAIRLPSLRQRFIPQSQWQGNIVKAQEFVLDDSPPAYVMAGSSLTARLDENDLGTDFTNLAFSGGSTLTGLELVKQKPTGVKAVFIEANFVFRDLDRPVLDNVFRPLFFDLRTHSVALREKFQPASLLAGKLGEKVVATLLTPLNRLSQASPPASDLFDRLLAEQRVTFSERVDKITMDLRLDQLEQQVRNLEAHGVRCIFVEMPVDPSLRNLPLATQVRESLLERFPRDRYVWIVPDPNETYTTTDGLHLTGQDAVKLSHRMREFARN